ncbi:hypothetical protein BDV96DRAFT_484261 [Lophiotrema nucula]|uniref:Uncharacterized protein n=1 Tax=Lophiotrema nucula TaxID=690887 RepID=A0A6A5ZR48_9PLEO|nr:hypothetical protein BDV96DRAFT_484261 [Lophiotrema nucula]
MTFLRDVGSTMWSYISPRKTQERRDKPFKVPSLPTPATSRKGKIILQGSSPGPNTRVQTWDVKTPSPTFSSDDPALLPPSPPTSLERPYTDFEGDTLIDHMEENLQKGEDEKYDANDETLVVDEGRYVLDQKVDVEAERKRREEQGRELRGAGWTEDAIFLFQKLGMRGFEPILPMEWFHDFGALPADLFTRKIDLAYVKALGDDFHAQKALDGLFNLGPRARDAILTDAHPRTAEWHIKRFVRQYNQWAMKDVGMDTIWRDLSLFEVVSGPKGVDADSMESKMKTKLQRLALHWNTAFRMTQHESLDAEAVPALPTLYGVISSHTIMAFVSYDPLSKDDILRTVAMFDWGQEGYDVWNVIAVAIFVIHCRNRMLELKDWIPEASVEASSDPDL